MGGFVRSNSVTTSKEGVKSGLILAILFNTSHLRRNLTWLGERNAEGLGSHGRCAGFDFDIALAQLLDLQW